MCGGGGRDGECVCVWGGGGYVLTNFTGFKLLPLASVYILALWPT